MAEGKRTELADVKMEKEGTELAACGCCGNFVEVPVGTCWEDVYCKDCMGNPEARSFRKKIGWAGQMFYEARFDVVRKQLSPESQAKWDKCSYAKKCSIIGHFIEKGLMI